MSDQMNKRETTRRFRTVMRGYEPGEVDQELARSDAELAGERTRAAGLADQLEHHSRLLEQARAETQRAQRAQAAAEAAAKSAAEEAASPDFSHLGERIGRILTLAEEEANQLRSQYVGESQRMLADAETHAVNTRKEADRYADEARGSAEQDATRVRADAQHEAAQMLDEADRQATARRREADAVFEQQRAQAAKAAADFEQTLAQRRTEAERVFQERTALAEEQLASAQERAAQVQAESDASAADAVRRAAELTAQSEQRAEQIVADAVARAGRIQAESERELAAAVQRRDSINSQLRNVRQMLATLSGTNPAALGLVDDESAAAGHGEQADGADTGRDGSAEEAPGAAVEEQEQRDEVEAGSRAT